MSEDIQHKDSEPRYELGQFVCQPEQFSSVNNIRYIVAEVLPGIHYVLHLDSRWFSHARIRDVAIEDFPQFAKTKIAGGGFLRRDRDGSNKVIHAELNGRLQSFRAEPEDVRAAFQSIVRQKLIELGLLQPSL